MDVSDPLAVLAERIGRVSIAWNNVQYVIFLIFTKLSGLTAEKAQAIFFSLNADRAQRTMTTDLAISTLTSDPVLLEQFVGIMKNVNALAGERNAATHTMWENVDGKIAPTPGAKKHGLLKEDFTSQFQDLEKKLSDQFADLTALLELMS